MSQAICVMSPISITINYIFVPLLKPFCDGKIIFPAPAIPVFYERAEKSGPER